MSTVQSNFHPVRNKIKESTGRKVFRLINFLILVGLTLICFLPFVNVIAMSFSENYYVEANQVTFWPMGFTMSAYQYIVTRASFWSSFRTSIIRVLLGGSLEDQEEDTNYTDFVYKYYTGTSGSSIIAELAEEIYNNATYKEKVPTDEVIYHEAVTHEEYVLIGTSMEIDFVNNT